MSSVQCFQVPTEISSETQISLRIFAFSLASHVGYYCPIFEPSMLIFEVWEWHVPSFMTLRKERNSLQLETISDD